MHLGCGHGSSCPGLDVLALRPNEAPHHDEASLLHPHDGDLSTLVAQLCEGLTEPAT